MPPRDSTRRGYSATPALSFRCASCNRAFVSNQGKDAACGCGSSISVNDSIFALNSPSQVKGHRINNEKFDHFIQQANSLAWARAFYELQRNLEQDAVHFFQATLKEKLAGWKWVLPFKVNSRFLLIGARQEAIALSLASHGAEVLVVDRCRDRLISTMLAANALGATVSCLEVSSLEDLPLVSDTFDAVIVPDLQDTLRYFGNSLDRTIPIAHLKAFKRLLSVHGVLFVAGDNRFTFSGTVAEQEESSTSSGRRARKSSTSGNSFRGYQQRIREAGLYPSEIYAPIPNHRCAKEYIPLSGCGAAVKNSQQQMARHVKERIAVHPQFLKAFGHSFAIIASSSESGAYSFLHEALLRLEWQLKLPGLSLEQIRYTEDETLIYCVSQNVHLLLRVPLSMHYSCNTAANAQRLKQLSRENVPKFLRSIAPRWLNTFEQERVLITAESRPSGRPLNEFVKELSDSKYTEGILQLLLALSGIRRTGAQPVFPLMSEMLDSIQSRIIDKAVRQKFEELARSIIVSVKQLGLPGVLVHGALGLDSINWDSKTSEVTGVTAWHYSLDRGLPGWDCVALESSYLQYQFGCSFGESILWLLEQGSPAPFREVWNRYSDSLRIHSGQREVLVLSYWLVHVWHNLSKPTTPLNYPWIRRNLISVIEKQNVHLILINLGIVVKR